MSGQKRFTLRMPEELFDQLKIVADSNLRPVSKEIIVAINYYLNENSDSSTNK